MTSDLRQLTEHVTFCDTETQETKSFLFSLTKNLLMFQFGSEYQHEHGAPPPVINHQLLINQRRRRQKRQRRRDSPPKTLINKELRRERGARSDRGGETREEDGDT